MCKEPKWSTNGSSDVDLDPRAYQMKTMLWVRRYLNAFSSTLFLLTQWLTFYIPHNGVQNSRMWILDLNLDNWWVCRVLSQQSSRMQHKDLDLWHLSHGFGQPKWA